MNPETTVTATAPHTRSYEATIALEQGAHVSVLRRDTTWPEWLWCRAADGREGWVHESILDVQGDEAITLEDFDALELSVQEGEALRCLKRLGGWAWCVNHRGATGWVPETCLSDPKGA